MSKEKKNNNKKAKTKSSKNSKKNIFEIVKKYFKGVFKETKMVKWTSKKDLVKYSIASIFFVIFFCIYFYVLDVIIAIIRSRI